jgi:hypothetical protein
LVVADAHPVKLLSKLLIARFELLALNRKSATERLSMFMRASLSGPIIGALSGGSTAQYEPG